MRSGEEEAVVAELETYLQRVEKVSKQQVSHLIKTAQHFVKQKQHRKFISYIFASLKKKLNRETFSSTCKRFLILIDELLELSTRVALFSPYAPQISKNIVDCYIFTFTLIFQYQQLESSLDWKVYRMLWAKMIPDDIFTNLRIQIAKRFRNFDLNKGFAQENIDRIKKRYNKKGFTEEQITKYFDSSPLDLKKKTGTVNQKLEEKNYESITTPKREQSSYSSNEKNIVIELKAFEPNLNKKVHLDRSSPFNRQSSGQNFVQNIKEGNRQKIMRLPNNIHPLMQQQKQIPITYSPFTPPTNTSVTVPSDIRSYSYSSARPVEPFITTNQIYPKPKQNNIDYRVIGNNSLNYPQKQQKISRTNSSQERNIQKIKSQVQQPHIICKKLRLKLSEHRFQCRYCGLLLISKSSLEEHQISHLNEAHNQFLRKESDSCAGPNKNNNHKNAFDRLVPVESWILNEKSDTNDDHAYQISISALNNESQQNSTFSFNCYFCQQSLSITWCQLLQEWTLKNSIKLKVNNEIMTVCHISCYQYFSSLQAEQPKATHS